MQSKQVDEMTHDDIADFTAAYIRKNGFPISFSNMTSVNLREQPDVLGIDIIGVSFLGEVKISRSDFLADQKKEFRSNGDGIGDFRVYITSKGLLDPKEIPYGWMLWEVHGKTKPIMKIVKGKKMVKTNHGSWSSSTPVYLNTSLEEYRFFIKDYKTKSYQSELMWLIQVMRRLQSSGVEPNDFANNYQINK